MQEVLREYYKGWELIWMVDPISFPTKYQMVLKAKQKQKKHKIFRKFNHSIKEMEMKELRKEMKNEIKNLIHNL